MLASEPRCCICLITLVLLEAGSTSSTDLYWLIRFYSYPKHREVVSTCTGCPLAPVKFLPDTLFRYFVITKEKSSKQAECSQKHDESNFRAVNTPSCPRRRCKPHLVSSQQKMRAKIWGILSQPFVWSVFSAQLAGEAECTQRLVVWAFTWTTDKAVDEEGAH